jgi:ribosomal protein S27AE
MRRPPVWESHKLQMVEMRRSGYTLQKIGDYVGVSRERVRQILEEHHVKPEAGLLTETKVANVIGCSIGRLRRLRQQGMLNPVHRGNPFHYYDRAELEKVKLALQRRCPRCGELLPMVHVGRYCSRCQSANRKYRYPSPGQDGRRTPRERQNLTKESR